MIIRYKSKRLEKICTEPTEAKKKYGFRMAAEISDCIDDIQAAESVEMMIKLGLHRCHPLHNNRFGQYAMDLIHPYRLIFEKDDEGKIHIVKIIEIVDYH